MVVSILPSGDTYQKVVRNAPLPKQATKGSDMVQDKQDESSVETHRIITTEGEIVRYLADGNFVIYFVDGSIT